jgi:hypothetical protein
MKRYTLFPNPSQASQNPPGYHIMSATAHAGMLMTLESKQPGDIKPFLTAIRAILELSATCYNTIQNRNRAIIYKTRQCTTCITCITLKWAAYRISNCIVPTDCVIAFSREDVKLPVAIARHCQWQKQC